MSTPLEQWVESVARITRPAQIQWCDGSEEEAARIETQLVREGQTFPLNEKTYPHCFLHRSDPSDVARTEKVTFICTRNRDDAGPTNNWMAPAEAKQTLGGLFDGLVPIGGHGIKLLVLNLYTQYDAECCRWFGGPMACIRPGSAARRLWRDRRPCCARP